jgi:hypothetical protein
VHVGDLPKAEQNVVPTGEEGSASSSRHRRSARERSTRRWRRSVRRAGLIALAVICLGAAGTGWVIRKGITARDHLGHAAVLVQQLRRQLENVDPAASKTLGELQRETRAARSDTRDPVWRIAGHAPVAGDDLAAVRTVAAALDDLAHDGLPPLVETAGMLNVGALTPKDGRIDLAPLQRAAPRLAAADAAVSRARDRIAAIAVDGLVGPIKAAVGRLLEDLDGAADTTATAARSAALLPPMLGAGGPRDYLVLFQNLAEVRATGGMPGAYVVVRADRGKIGIVDQGTAAGLKPFDRPVLTLDASDRALYSDRLGKFPANINLTPHFPTAGKLAREMYRRRTGRTVDGVLATDPVALSYLLRAIGTVPVPGGTDLTAANAVPVLLSKTYDEDVPLDVQDRYFGAAAKAVFQAVVQRPLDPSKLLAELARAAGERRLLVWSAHPAENQMLAGTVLTGVLPDSDGTRPTVGVFLNDGSGAKLGYYLTQSADLAVAGGCRADGRRELTLRVTLGSTAPKTGLSPYVLGLGLAGDPYTIRTVVSIYSPASGALDTMELDGEPTRFGSGRDRGRSVGIVAVDLKPGAERTLEVTLLTGVGAIVGDAPVVPRLWTTPAVNRWQQSVRSADGCPMSR